MDVPGHFCSQCGATITHGTKFCPDCGAPIGATLAVEPPPLLATAPSAAVVPAPVEPISFAVAPPPLVTTPPTLHYAGFWIRAIALLVDALILGVPLAFVVAALSATGVLVVGVPIIGALAGWLYFALLECSPRQATIGKSLCRLKVTDIHGRRISTGRATARYFAKYISDVLLIGYILVPFSEKKQGLHDLIADTLVIRSTS